MKTVENKATRKALVKEFNVSEEMLLSPYFNWEYALCEYYIYNNNRDNNMYMWHLKNNDNMKKYLVELLLNGKILKNCRFEELKESLEDTFDDKELVQLAFGKISIEGELKERLIDAIYDNIICKDIIDNENILKDYFDYEGSENPSIIIVNFEK